MRPRLSIALVAVLCSLMPSCKAIRSLVHDGEVIARYGDQKLYRSELEGVIPKGVSPEDSARLASQYIDSWAKDKAFLLVAEQRLPKGEKDVTKDLEAYRSSLLKYRFEQHYINERLDTNVSVKQVKDYYDAHLDEFRLPRAIVKARFIRMPKDAPDYPSLKKLISSEEGPDNVVRDSIILNPAIHYHDFSGAWIDVAALAAEFDLDYVQFMASRVGQAVEITSGDVTSYSYILDLVRAGEIPPIDYCKSRIKDVLIGERKHELLTTLERDLIEEARTSDKFEIY